VSDSVEVLVCYKGAVIVVQFGDDVSHLRLLRVYDLGLNGRGPLGQLTQFVHLVGANDKEKESN
jgi:hypothetical protein